VTWFKKPDPNDSYRFHCCTYAQQTPVCPDPEFSFIFLHFYLVLCHVRCYTENITQESEWTRLWTVHTQNEGRQYVLLHSNQLNGQITHLHNMFGYFDFSHYCINNITIQDTGVWSKTCYNVQRCKKTPLPFSNFIKKTVHEVLSRVCIAVSMSNINNIHKNSFHCHHYSKQTLCFRHHCFYPLVKPPGSFWKVVFDYLWQWKMSLILLI